jgi:hypothetical protein
MNKIFKDDCAGKWKILNVNAHTVEHVIKAK